MLSQQTHWSLKWRKNSLGSCALTLPLPKMTLPGDYISQLHEVVWPVCKHQTNFLYMIKVARPFGPRGRPGGGIQRGCCTNNCWGRRDPQRPWCQFNRLKKRLKTRLKNHLRFKFDSMTGLNYHFFTAKWRSLRGLQAGFQQITAELPWSPGKSFGGKIQMSLSS